MQLNVVCSVRTLFESSFGLISDKIYISVFDEVFMRTCCVYDINYYEFFEGELDRERALVFLIIAVQIFEAIIEKAELVSYKVNGMHVARVVLRQIIKFSMRRKSIYLPKTKQSSLARTINLLTLSSAPISMKPTLLLVFYPDCSCGSFFC